jgi:hypothetical protein
MNAITPARDRLVLCLGMLGSAQIGILAGIAAKLGAGRDSGA